MAKTFLDVPFKEKDAAKALGARWEPVAKRWYVPEGLDLGGFSAWLPVDRKLSTPVAQTDSNDLLATEPGTVSNPLTPQKGISLSQLLAGVAQAVVNAFPVGVWTVVEVVEARTKNGHVYLELSERTPGGQVLATARASIWASTASRILPEFERTTGASIAPGIKLFVRAKPVFKAQYGFGIEIDAIDPEYTLGDLEARKREIRTRLKQVGVIDANRSLPAPWDYNAVLVIAPQGAAGLGDFQAEAQRLAGFGICRFEYVHSRFQGEGAAQEIRRALLAALERWSGLPPDAVVIIRGGGAVNDLAWLNDYDLAHAVCTLPVPVLTGIGHERDSTILDEVAHTRFDTPSKVIAGIEQRIRQRVAEVKSAFESLTHLSSRAVAVSRTQAEQRFSAIGSGAARQLALARQQTRETINEIRLSATTTLHEARQETQRLIADVRHDAHQSLNEAKREVPSRMAEIRAEASNVINVARTTTATRLDNIRERARMDLLRSRSGVRLELRDITTYARRTLVDARTRTTSLFREIAGQGPDKTLGRGFAIVRNAHGKPVTTQSDVQLGEPLNIELRDGYVVSQAQSRQAK